MLYLPGLQSKILFSGKQKLLFSTADSHTLRVAMEECKTIDSGHGRIETRFFSVLHETPFQTTENQWAALPG